MKNLKTIILSGIFSLSLNSSIASNHISKIPYRNDYTNIEEKLIKNSERTILIDKSEHKLILYNKNKIIKKYHIATGKDPINKTKIGQNSTPEGIFLINKKRKVNSYDFGTRVIGLDTDYLGFKGIYIHGTNKIKSIGKNASHGCIRMRKKDIEELYKIIKLDDSVIIK